MPDLVSAVWGGQRRPQPREAAHAARAGLEVAPMTLATLQGLADCLRHAAPLAEQDEQESARLEHYVNVVHQWVHDLSDSSCLERFVHSGEGYVLTHLLKVVMVADLTANCCRLREVVAETLQIL